MKPLRANTALVNCGDRLARTWITPSSRAVDRAPAAEAVSLSASAAFSHYTESVGAVPDPGSARAGSASDKIPAFQSRSAVTDMAPTKTAPAFNPKPPVQAGAVILSEHAQILLQAVAAYERCDASKAITLALATHVKRIGAGPLARGVLDEIERNHSTHKLAERVDGGAGINSASPAGTHAGEDLTDLPAFERRPFNRYRSGGP